MAIRWTQKQREVARLFQGGQSFTEIVKAGYSKDMTSRVMNELKAGGGPPSGIDPVPEAKGTPPSLGAGAKVVTIDETTPREEILTRVRGSLGLAARPKVVNIVTPELLYPAMVISQQEWGWSAMAPEDFIDTVLDKFIRATGIELNTYLKTEELEKLLKFADEHGYFKGNKEKEVKHDSAEPARPVSEGSQTGAK